MGAQINFYMDLQTEINFFKFIEKEGFKFLYQDLDEEILIEFNNFNEIPFQDKKVRWLYLYKDNFGKLDFTNYANYRIDLITSPVIEFIRTLVNDEKKQINEGRLWIESKYYKDGQLIKKPDEFIDSYNLLCKWIKKNVPKKEVVASGRIVKKHINDRLREKVDDEYILRK